jgi:NADPH2:quinone reductase
MKYIKIQKPGGPEMLSIAETSTPAPDRQEVLIEVAAAGINRPDCFQRQGHYPPPPGASEILGLEVSGKVVQCGEAVTRFKVGDSVCALLAGGGYAEYALAPEGQCLPIPDGFDFIQAAALPETFFTVWTNLFEDGRLKSGESVLIHGGSGGIGTTAIQLAHAFGAMVLTTVGKRESVDVCKQAGADQVFLYKEEDYVIRTKAITEGLGVNVILDMVGGSYFERNLDSLAYQGRLVQIATLQGSTVECNLSLIMKKRLIVTGSTLRARTVAEKTRLAQAVEKNVWPLLNQGKLKPIIYKTFPLSQAAEAHTLMESSQHTGKIVLTMN